MGHIILALSIILFFISSNISYAAGFVFACSPYEFNDGSNGEFGLNGNLSGKILTINEPQRNITPKSLQKADEPKIWLRTNEYYEIRTANQWHNPSALYEDIGHHELLIIKPIGFEQWGSGLPPKFKITIILPSSSLIDRSMRWGTTIFASCNTID
tara:strand:- start:52 stop:519 length:468 start_codon:yes stop_codon:yes gene_type:complete